MEWTELKVHELSTLGVMSFRSG